MKFRIYIMLILIGVLAYFYFSDEPITDISSPSVNTVKYIELATFGDGNSSTITETTDSLGQISFKLNDGTVHSYSGYTSYRLMVVKYGNGSNEKIIVYRSKEKEVQ